MENGCIPDITVLYASQTGQAKAIAEEIHAELQNTGIPATIFCLSLIDKKFSLNQKSCVIFVVSTTGDGEPPDTARKCFRRLSKKTISNIYLEDNFFGLLALGDSNYTNFCNFGKKLEKRLLELGARQFYQTGYADDAVGLEIVVEPWIEGLLPALNKLQINYFDLKVKQEPSSSSSTSFVAPGDKHSIKIENSASADNDSILHPVCEELYISAGAGIGNDVGNAKNSLTLPSPDLANTALKMPCYAPCSLEIEYPPAEVVTSSKKFWSAYGSQAGISDVFLAKIIGARMLTLDNAPKTTLELKLDISRLKIDFQPGDTFGILCPNEHEVVDYIIRRLFCEDVADVPCRLKISKRDNREDALPERIPECSTLRDLFVNSVDIRAVPKKTFLRMLSEYTNNKVEKRRLQELCSVQGARDYAKWIREPYTGLIDILRAFPSCTPPVEKLIGSLPRLQPRAYSVSSSPLEDKNSVKFIFNITDISGVPGATLPRKGLCTGWLHRITSAMSVKQCSSCEIDKTDSLDILDKEMELMQILDCPEIPVFWRKRTAFRLPADDSIPIIMIGAGTGLSPFIGFLQHRERQKRVNSNGEYGSLSLFYGCRYKHKDFLYRGELENFAANRILTEMFVSFSRDDHQERDAPRYVQDNLKLQQNLVMNLLLNNNAIVYVCGDARHMARDVYKTFLVMLQTAKNLSEKQAFTMLATLKEEQRYLEDIWT